MAKGVRRSIDDRIAEIDAKIFKKQEEISALKERRKELEMSRKTELAEKVVQLAEEKGISIDALFNSLKSK
ncbi:MAG: hypothetical protein LBV27_06730 [Oscillospiraceae bacterium]|jgi:hypothetical protein|nr:hypothetical protein [Oscillospiraceae bacterium]